MRDNTERKVVVERDQKFYNGSPGAITYRAYFFHYDDIKGCPLGRGCSEEDAIDDLVYRTNMESKLDIRMDQITVESFHDFT